MDNSKYIVAIEIGSSKTVGAIAEKTVNGQVIVRGVESEPTLNCVRYGCIQNVDSVKASVNRIIMKLNNYIVGGDIKDVYVGISGRSLHSVPVEVQRTLNGEQAITQPLLNELKNEAFRKYFNGYDSIDVIPRSFTIDKSETNNPVGIYGTEIKAKYCLLVAKPSIKLNLNRVFNQNHSIKGFITTPIAVAKAILTEDERSVGCMLVDLGAETTTVSIYRNDALVYLTTIPLGGRNLTRDITALNIREESAEKIKKNINEPLNPTAESVTIDGIKSSDAANYILARTGEIIANVTAQLANANMTTKDVSSIVLVGGGAMLNGIKKEVENITNLPVRIAASMPRALTVTSAFSTPPDHMGIFALLVAGNSLIGDGTCVAHRQFVPTPASQSTTVSAPQIPAEPARPQPAPKKPSIFGKIKDKLINVLNEDDNEDDNY